MRTHNLITPYFGAKDVHCSWSNGIIWLGKFTSKFHKISISIQNWHCGIVNDLSKRMGDKITASPNRFPKKNSRRRFTTRWTPWKIFDSNFDFQKGNGFWNWIKGILEKSWDGSQKKMEHGFLGWFKHFEVVGELVRSIFFESFDLQKSTA